MSYSLHRWPLLSIACLALALSACESDSTSQPTTTPQNQAPVADAGPDQAVLSGQTVSLDGTASSDADGTIAGYSWVQTAGSPAVSLSGAATAQPTFTAPAVSSPRVFTFRLTVTDDDGATGRDSVNVTVSAVNEPPVANNDSAATLEDTPVTVAVLANDTDPNGAADLDPASVAVSNASNGAAVANPDGTVTFTPALNFAGTGSFQYTVRDQAGATSNAAAVTVAVQAVNDAPTISDIPDQVTNEDVTKGPIPFTIGDADNAVGSLVLSAASSDPAKVPVGNITFGGSGANRTVTVKPAANANGSVTITITVSDGAAGSSDSFVLTIIPVNDPPLAQPATTSTAEDTPVSGTLQAQDPDGDTLTFSANGPATHGSVVIAADGAYTFTPAPDFSGDAAFGFKACDASLCSSATVGVTVTPVDDAPSISAIADRTTAEDTPAGPIAFTVSDPDTPVNSLTLSGASDNTALVPVANIAFGGSGANRTVTVTPAANASGVATITVTVSDGSGSASEAFVLTVTAVNDLPVITAIADQTTAEDTPAGPIAFSVSDADGDTLTVSASSGNQALVPDANIAIAGGPDDYTLTLTPADDANGQATITVSVSDGTGTSTETFVLTVTGVNDAPAISAIEDQVTAEDTPAGPIPFTVGDADQDPGTLTVTATVDDDELVSSITLGGSGANRTVTVTPAPNAHGGPATVTVTVSDGTASASESFDLTVTAVNDAPVADDAGFSVDEDTLLDGQLTGSDVEGDPLTFGAVTQPAHGTLDLDVDGAFTYAPALNFAGTDSFTFKVNDGAADSAPATVTITVGDVAEAALVVTGMSVNENEAGTRTLDFTVSLTRDPDGPVTVAYETQDVTARAGSDYASASGSLVFTTSEGQVVSVTFFDDDFDEADELVGLAVAATEGGGSLAGPATGTGTIVDDEDKGLLQVGAAKVVITPSNGQIAGQTESYQSGTRTQYFHLGGFGIGPVKIAPELLGLTPEFEFTQAGNAEARARCFARAQLDANLTQFDAELCDDHTWVRVLVMLEPDGDRVAFVTIDAVGAGNLIQDGMKAAIVAASHELGAEIPAANILFGQTHSHAGADLQGLWGGVPREWIEGVLYAAGAEATREALRTAVPANLVMARGIEDAYNSYRRPIVRGDEEVDTMITVLQARPDDDPSRAVGSIVQYAAHPTAVGTGDYRRPDGTVIRVPHPDYPLGIENEFEASFGGTALYYNGPIADASGSGPTAGATKYDQVKDRGQRIARRAQDFLAANAVDIDPVIGVRHATATLPVTNPAFLALGAAGAFNGYYQFTQIPRDQIPGLDAVGDQFDEVEAARNQLPQLAPVAITLVSRISLGTPNLLPNDSSNRLEIVTIPGESTNTFGQYIRRLARQDPANVAAPDTHTMLLGLTQNSFGYIIPEEEFGAYEPPVPTELPYEETVSLGPLTAPLLRIQAYHPLFDVPPENSVPPYLTACLDDPFAYECVVSRLQDQLALGFLFEAIGGGLQAFADACHGFADGTPFEVICDAVDVLAGLAGSEPAEGDLELATLAADTAARGCDLLDGANCLYPFPNDWFTAPAAPGSIQDLPRGTGRRVNIHPAATPRNALGRPVDPAEWNRNDGFSPGALVTTYVPGLSLERTFARPSHAIGAANLALSQDPGSPILVLEVDENGGAPARHLVWAELDQNANILTIAGVPNVGTSEIPGVTNEYGHVMRPQADGKAALLIRPAKNFSEGKRYVVVLRNLKDAAGNPIPPQTGFRACMAGDSPLPPVQGRCGQLEDKVFPVLDAAGIARDESLFLAWDFTVQSTGGMIGRLRHMRDDAFGTLAVNPAVDDCTQLTDANAVQCAAPAVQVTGVLDNPQDGIARRIEGTITVPNYLAPVGPSPLDDPAIHSFLNRLCEAAPEGDFEEGCRDFRDAADIAQGAALPSRLFYSPADGAPNVDPNNAGDPLGLRYGDGLPDRNGQMTARFLCQIPAQATPDNPARASLYGHGQLDRGVAITYEGTPDVAREHNYMFCAVDWFGFRTGDAANVLSTLVDLSNFAVIPDASQQGMLNFMFLARAMQHPRGFGALPEFQAEDGRPLFDRSEIFYNGNSQGGIFGGVVLAASKDVNRGVLGSLGMNYSTLLTRSKNFDEYAGILYGSYADPLDRQLLFSMIQMLWDRSENNGYAHHLVDNSAFGGPGNVVKLDTMFGDPQVTMFSAEVMARTMGVPYDDRQVPAAIAHGADSGVNGLRHPGVEPYEGLVPINYGSADAGGSALIVWDTADNEAQQSNFAHIPPITNTPPRTGPDRHDASQKRAFGRCHMAHFLRTGGQLIDILPVQYGGAACPPVPPAAPTTVPGAGGEASLQGALDRFTEAVASFFENLLGADLIHALNAALGGAQQFVADVLEVLLREIAEALGQRLPLPGAGANPEPVPVQPLLAGVAKKSILVPVGTPLGGYLRPPVGGEYIGDDPEGELLDNLPGQADGCDPEHPESCPPLLPLPDELRAITSPYATYFPPSRGYYDSLIAKAVALYDGNDYVVLVKTDFIGMLDEVVQDVRAAVKARRGIDLNDGLIMSATHSHDGPGALANHSTRYFWLAMDLYQHDVYRRLVPQLADVVVAALDDLAARREAGRFARIGHASGLEAPEVGGGNGLNGYRRGRFARYADDDQPGCNYITTGPCPPNLNDADELRKRIGILRVDDAATGEPLAVVINFADHGIAFDVENQYFSGDVLGAIEREVEQTYPPRPGGTPTIAMLVQNTGGDVTPKNVEYSIRGIEALGKRMAPQVRGVADSITTFQAAPDLRGVSQRVILNRERLGYGPDEYPYPWGAAQCGNDIAVPFADVGVRDIPGYEGSGLPVKHPYCIFSPPPDPADLADNGVAENGAFLPQDTIVRAVKIGAITLLVQPGEPLTEYGVRLMKMAQDEGSAPADTFVWGYAADHVGYLLPPEEDDWATFGGAESTTTFWGWKQGERLIEASRGLVRALQDGTAPPADEFQVNYGLYKQLYDLTPAAQPTPSLLPGTIVTEPDDIRRFEATTFVFEGGDPVLDLPYVVMEDALTGLPVRRANGEILDTFFEMHLKYRLVSGRHLWTVAFEAPKDWPSGRYRFRASGRALGVPAEYAVTSAPFGMAPAQDLETTPVQCGASTCSTQLRYRPVPLNYRIVDLEVRNDQPAPVRDGSVTFTCSTGGSQTVVRSNAGGNPVTYTAALACPGGTVTASGSDIYGNTTPGGATPGGSEESIAACLLTQDPAACQGAIESLGDLQDCEFDESGFNCAYEVLADAIGLQTLAAAMSSFIATCDDTPAAPGCEFVRSTGGAPDALPVASEAVARGDLVFSPAAPMAPGGKTVDGTIGDWPGVATRIGGTAIHSRGEHVYTDFLFDAFGADDGDDARRLAALALLGQLNTRTARIDALQQAGNDQLDVPAPAGSAGGDRYGDSANREDGTDLTEVRWAADASSLYLLARVAKLETASNLVLLVLADTSDGTGGMRGLDAGLSSAIFDRAVVFEGESSRVIDLVSGGAIASPVVARVNASGWTNALEASIPRGVLERGDGSIRVAVLTARKIGSRYVPANAAYRFDEPVTIYGERAQALALFGGNVDGFTARIALADLVSGRTQTAVPGPGYHERQFASGENISIESDPENGRLQPYGLFVPSAPAQNPLGQTRLTIWTHYRGGKAHSGAAWTPRLIHQLGEEQGNLVATPRARGTSTWYTTRAHQDFFEVFADVAGTAVLKQYANENLPAGHGFPATGLFSIDPARIYISGYSMGGFATYLFSGLYPDLFAAGFSQSGAVTQGAWTGLGPDDGTCGGESQTIPFIDETGTVCFVEANNGRANAQLNYRILDNTRHVPITIHHGTNDELALTPGALRMGQRLLELQYRYDATTFLGYEHFTQAIVDEWRDGAHFLNLYARPENPRVVTYKVVPALVKAVNEVQLGSANGGAPFTFNPDGAYWVDGLLVRDGAGGGDPSVFGQIDAQSDAIARNSYVAVPRTVAANPDTLWLTTPVLSPGSHSTPFVRHGLEWVDVPGQTEPVANRFSAALTNLLAATLSAPRMALDPASRIDGTLSSDGDATVILAGVGAPMTLCTGNAPGVNVPSGGDAVINLAAGVTSVALLPGLGQNCAGAGFLASPADTPDYADLCESYGADPTGAVCGLLRDAETQLRGQCEDAGAPASSCTLAGGNLHALLDTCYEQTGGDIESRNDGLPLPACRVVDAFVLGAAAWCRQFSNATNEAQRAEACALIGGVHISERELAAYENSWVHTALRLQNRLGYDLPFVHTSVVATHNSYNATDDNTPPTLSGSDANQFYDVPGQLRMGVRAIEIDVHWMPGNGPDSVNGRQPVACHGNAEHFGCTHERPLRAVLQEVRGWLDANPGEAILLYVEDNLNEPSDVLLYGNTPYRAAGKVFEEVLGDKLYRPADHGASCNDAAALSDPRSWLRVTREQVLEAGRQILSYAETCGSGVPAWAGLFHRKTNEAIDQSGDQVGVQYPGKCVYSRATHDTKWTRVWHDVTVVGAATGAGDDYVTPAMARELMRCGMDMPSLDFLTPSDGRLEAMVWSWAPNEPAADAGANDCAVHGADGRLRAGDCTVPRRLACTSNNGATWVFTNPANWNGEACPAGSFSVPGNGYFNEKLKEAKAAAGVSEVWVNYRRTGPGPEDWISDHDEGLVLPGGAGSATGAIESQGFFGLVAELLGQVASAAMALLQTDLTAAATTLAEAIATALDEAFATVVGDLLAALSEFAAALQGVVDALASDPATAPSELVNATNGLMQDLAAAAGAAHLVAPDEGVCAPDNAWVPATWPAQAPFHFKGSLHEHSGYSDGRPGTEPRDYFEDGRFYGLDFMGGSEHSDNADLPMTVTDACLDEDLDDCAVADNDNPVDAFRKWDATLEQARAASDAAFTAFRGFEWTSDRFGHINVFFSRHDWNAKSTEGYALSMESFWTWFTTRPELGGGSDGIAVFNHPGREDAIESQVPNLDPAYAFNDFEYRREAGLRTVGIETYGKSGDIYDADNAPAGGWYAYALDKGWHVGPVGAEDEHSTGANEEWGKPTRAKTILIARDRSEGALREALLARRFYSVRHNYNDVRLTFSGNGAPMGSRLALGAGAMVTLSGAINADAGKIDALEIVTSGGVVVGGREPGTAITRAVFADGTERWYYLRAIGLDGRPSAYSAPIWVQARGAYPVCGEWLAGDLHVHTTFSHDSYGGPDDDNTGPDEFYTLGHSVDSQFRIASARGLDYLAITDHNDIRSQADPAFGAHGVIPLPSYENSLSGHAQMHGATTIYNNAQPLQALADALRSAGGVFQINHPAGESVDWPRDADWGEARTNADAVDYTGDVVPDTIEVWNISWLWNPPAPSGNSIDDAVRYWEGWLDRGAKVAATGGSDNHYLATTPIQGNGQPTTWVFATERSARGVLEGMRAGRTAISHQPPLLRAPRLMLEADADGDGVYEAVVGDSVPAGAALRVRALDAQGAQIRVISNGGVLRHGPIPSMTPVFEFRFTLPASATWVRAEAVEPDAQSQRATVCDGVVGDQTTYCRNRLAVLAMTSALYLE